jgi:exonuclease SbcD
VQIVHTSDWHAGRVWKSISRTNELADILEHLGDYIERKKIDLLLVSGDVFDNRAPAAEAERIVFRFFKRVGRAGTKTVVIAGNHDSPSRLEAWGTLTELVDVHVVPRPCRASEGGVLQFETRSGEKAVVAAVPFAAAQFLVSALELAADETLAMQKYADGMRRIVEHLCGSFRGDAVNLLMAHTHLEGALIAKSERQVHVGDQWAALPQMLPAQAHYSALGHIHRPQKIESAPGQAHYAGSPLQLDFGEVGEEKSFVLVDARPGRPSRVERVPYIGGQPLVEVMGTLAELERDAAGLRQKGWLRVGVRLTEPNPNLNGEIRRLLPNAVVVLPILPERPGLDSTAVRPTDPKDMFVEYYRSRNQTDPQPALVQAFVEMYETSHDEGD